MDGCHYHWAVCSDEMMDYDEYNNISWQRLNYFMSIENGWVDGILKNSIDQYRMDNIIIKEFDERIFERSHFYNWDENHLRRKYLYNFVWNELISMTNIFLTLTSISHIMECNWRNEDERTARTHTHFQVIYFHANLICELVTLHGW